MKITSNSTQNKQKIQKGQNDKETSFPKETVENADLHKPVLNKKTDHKRIMREIQFRSSFKNLLQVSFAQC